MGIGKKRNIQPEGKGPAWSAVRGVKSENNISFKIRTMAL
jgi:hypothetical protein